MRPKPSDTETKEPYKLRLAKRIFRDVDALAASRSEAAALTQRVNMLDCKKVRELTPTCSQQRAQYQSGSEFHF